MSNQPVRLNIGGGKSKIEGFQTWDLADGNNAYPLPHADGSVEEIYASHILEHFGHAAVPLVIKDWMRALRPSGRLRIAVPDRDMLWEKYKDHPAFDLYMYGGQTNVHDIHRSGWTWDKMTTMLRHNGAVDIKSFEPITTDCAQYEFSLNVECIKRPAFVVNPNPKIVACSSMPRLGFVETFKCIQNAIAEAHIPIIAGHDVGCAYFEKSLTMAIESALAAYPDLDYILTIDYDGIFTGKDLQMLLAAMQNDPTAAAAFPIQMMRGKPTIMIESGQYDRPLEVVQHGHFGLTMIRADVFRQLPHPWFWTMPDRDGRWTNACRDGDVVFWDRLKFEGYKVLRCNEVVIGHLEQTIIWPRGDRPQYQPLDQYKKVGRPKNAYWVTAMAIDDPFKWSEEDRFRTGWQYGEQGIVEEIVRRLGITKGTCVEFGAGEHCDNITCQGLILRGWDCLLMESDPANVTQLRGELAGRGNVRIDQRAIQPSGVGALDEALMAHKIPISLDVLVIDVDSFDYYVWESLKDHRPKVVVIEHQNEDFESNFSVPHIPSIQECIDGFDKERRIFVQANESAVKRLGESKGYTRVGRTKINSILVANEYLHLLRGPAPGPEKKSWDDVPADADGFKTITVPVSAQEKADLGALGMFTNRMLQTPVDVKANGHCAAAGA